MKNKQLENFFTSGWTFSEDESELKNKFQMMNIAFLPEGKLKKRATASLKILEATSSSYESSPYISSLFKLLKLELFMKRYLISD